MSWSKPMRAYLKTLVVLLLLVPAMALAEDRKPDTSPNPLSPGTVELLLSLIHI